MVMTPTRARCRVVRVPLLSIVALLKRPVAPNVKCWGRNSVDGVIDRPCSSCFNRAGGGGDPMGARPEALSPPCVLRTAYVQEDVAEEMLGDAETDAADNQ